MRPQLPEHNSEKIEPAFTHFIGIQWKRCELLYEHWQETGEYMDQLDFDSSIEIFWYGMKAWSKVHVACTGAHHMSLLLSSEMQRVKRYIKSRTGYNPISKEPEDHRLHLTMSKY